MNDRPTPISDYLLERLALGELPPARARELEARLEAEPGGPERLARLRASNEALQRELPPLGRIRARVEREKESTRKRWKWELGLAAPALAMVAAVFVLHTPAVDPQRSGTQLPGEVTRIKGGAELAIFRRTTSGSEPVESGDLVRAGDVLQLSYKAGPQSHGVILSVDGRGGVTLHFPEAANLPTQLEPRDLTALPHGYQLDDAPSFERFFFVSSKKPIDVAQVLAAARSLSTNPVQAANAELPLPAGLEQHAVLLRKAP
jgi:anti-sigma factor RsiW